MSLVGRGFPCGSSRHRELGGRVLPIPLLTGIRYPCDVLRDVVRIAAVVRVCSSSVLIKYQLSKLQALPAWRCQIRPTGIQFGQYPRQFPQLLTDRALVGIARHPRLTCRSLRTGGPLPRSPLLNCRRLLLPPFRGPTVHWVIPPKVCYARFRLPAPARGRPPEGRC